MRQHGAVHRVAKLLRQRLARLIGPGILIFGAMAVCAPMALIAAGIGIENDHAMVGISIGDIEFIGFGIDKCLGWPAEIFRVIASLALTGSPDLHQKLS